MSEPAITVRECVDIEDFQQCIELERAVWKDADVNIMPVRLYQISKACGAPTIGAFDGSGKLVGFVHTMLALIGRNCVFHSHMAAVLEDLRHKDIGYRMKLAQRERAIEAGISLIFWSFDPLQSRNAHLNINKLGAVVRRYEENYYGEGISSVFDGGVPSDRIFAEWWVASPHVNAALAGHRPGVPQPLASVTIPDSIAAVRAESIEKHVEWRMRVREQFGEALRTGAIVRGFARDSESGVSRYLLGEDDEQFHFEAYDGVRAGDNYRSNCPVR